MAEDKEIIHSRMLDSISNEYDKSEGSFFYDATGPSAIELEQLDLKAESILNKGFANTAKGLYLDLICSEQGVYRKLSTKSSGEVLVIGAIGARINKGDKVASDTVNFAFLEDKIIDATGQSIVKVQCEESGTIGNVPIGTIKYFPVTLSGLNTTTNKAAFINGYEEETDEALRQRYYDKVRTPATSGNKWHYLNWAKEITGVGDARAFPLWAGNGTVKIVIINSNKRAADENLINRVLEHIENNRPIGANVSVDSAQEKLIDITANLIIDTKNFTIESIKTSIEESLVNYFKEIAFVSNYVSYAYIGNLIFNISGVIDYSNLIINNGTSNIPIAEEEVPILGGVVLG